MSSIAQFTEVFTINTFAEPPSAAFQLNFLRDIQWLLESSSYTSTYKFALLMALANLSIESGIGDNNPHTISYRQLAEQFMQLYWLQAIPFAAQNEDSILRQSATKGQASVITLILNLQSDTKQTSLNKARTSDAKKWQSTITAATLVFGEVAGRINRRTAWAMFLLS